MKKILVIALSAIIITTVVGCSPKSGEINDNKSGVEENINNDKITHFGKVKSIVGNEVELEIASKDMLGISDEDDEKKGESESSPAMATTPSTMGENKEVVSGDANKDKMELEYTGEVKNIVIPGGVKVMDSRIGKDGNISDIKDGSVIIIYTDTTSDLISTIEILE